MLIDTHCHLNFKAFDKDLPAVIERAKKVGITKIIIPGAKIDSSKRGIAIAQQYGSCYAAIGIHPHHADAANKPKEVLFSLTKQAKVVAVGEIGLDYHQYHNYPPVSATAKKAQKELFLLQLELAGKTNLPVIIHCREAFTDLITLLTSFISRHAIKGVFHCFEGEKEQLNQVLDLGFYVGFDGNITYPENKHLRDLAKLTPLDRLLLETDSPFLTPLPFRGNRNEPAYLANIVEMATQIHKRQLKSVGENTTQNAQKLFNI